MAITTAMSTSFKAEVLQAAHCFNAPITTTGTLHTNNTVDVVTSMVGVAAGMGVTGTGIAANSSVVSIQTAAAFTVYPAATGSGAQSLTFTGDIFKIALIRSGMAGTYGAANVNYTDITGASDETTGAGYTAGGAAMTNVTPVISGTTAYTNFSPNPTWTSASFSTAGCMIYNSSTRLGGTSGTNTAGGGRCCGVFDFGGTQTVTSGTFTVVMPAATSSTAILRIA
jgi:hypothetical protein